MKDCKGLADFFEGKVKDLPIGNRKPPPDGGDKVFQNANKTVAMIFGGIAATEIKRDWKLTAR